MPLRCLLFSSHEELVEPIWKVLSDLGIEGEYCRSAVDAVEKVTTQPFQIVMTDWDDQPEAAFLLKTARDLKAAQRPLTLAIVSDDARLPEALRAGANSVLAKPIRPEQVRDIMGTACELLRAKQQPAGQQSGAPAIPKQATEAGKVASAGSAAAAAAPAPAPAPVPAPVTAAPQKTFSAIAPLRSAGAAPGVQSFNELHVKAAEAAEIPEADVIAPPEPTVVAADASGGQESKPKETLTGWAMLQARLNAPVFGTGKDTAAKTELLTYGETPSYGARRAEASKAELPRAELPEIKTATKHESNQESKHEAESEAALFAYMAGKARQAPEPVAEEQPKRGKILLFAAVVVACVAVVAVPQSRQSMLTMSRNAVRAGSRLLNPPPAPLPEAVVLHDSFGQSGDEYKLPAVGNIPDATTDPSQIQVLPVVDPTAKPEKGSEANSGQAQIPAVENSSHPDQNQAVTTPVPQENSASVVKDPTSTSVGTVPGVSIGAAPDPFVPQKPVQPVQVVPQFSVPPPVRTPAQTHTVSGGGSAGIPSSLRSQLASSTPEASGSKPAEAAMSSIEPVNLPESAARELLTQPVDPEYPASAKASGQRGSVVLQVLIGRDGAVQDAKFLQGSFVFARAAIDAVKQWRFKPYSMNGHAISVQSTITLSFKPPV